MVDAESKDLSGVIGRIVTEMNAKEGASAQERRRHDRSSYDHVQIFAPYVKDLPRRSDFFKMRCHNLSVGGLSFFWNERPQFDSLVFGLGSDPDIIFLTARIVRVVPHDDQFLVCCRFLGRLPGSAS